MRSVKPRRPLAVLAAVVTAAAVTTPAGPAVAGPLPDEVPSRATPDIENGATYAITQVGDKIIVGGTFSAVKDRDSSTLLNRDLLFAFDASTGRVDTGFAPDIDGKKVSALLPGPNDHSVYVGGRFTSVDGANRRHLALVDTDTGEVVTSFDPPSFNRPVRTLRKTAGQLLVGGVFTAVGGGDRNGLASVDAVTGVRNSYLDVALKGHHNWDGEDGHAKGGVGATAMDLSPDGSTLAVVGNFTTADGLARDQIVRISLGADDASVDEDWSTDAYEDECNERMFDGYVRDVDVSADGTYFAVATSGGYGGPSSACDATARFEMSATGSVDPTWVDFTGADTLYSVHAAPDVVYIGGHQRWLNNHDGHDDPGPGAVPRPGIGALDARTGVPVSWNPGRHPRGVGARALFATDSGLYVGSDTDYIGNRRYHRGKIAYFPFSGDQLPPEDTGSLPGTLYLARPGDGHAITRSFDGSTVGPDRDAAGTGSWALVRGIVQVDDTLFYGTSDAMMRKRTFDGTTFGPVRDVDPYNDPEWSDVETGSGQTYRGRLPSFYAQLPDVTGTAYRDGRLYYTLAGEYGLYWRAFSPDSGVVSNVEHEVHRMTRWGRAGGMFLDGDTLYFTSRLSGNLYATAWSGGVPDGSLTAVSGPNHDGRDWRTRALFLRAD